jgi:hypothetical protein
VKKFIAYLAIFSMLESIFASVSPKYGYNLKPAEK